MGNLWIVSLLYSVSDIHKRTGSCCTHCVHGLATGLLVYQYLLIYLLLCIIFSDRLMFFKATNEGCFFRIHVRVHIEPRSICSELYLICTARFHSVLLTLKISFKLHYK